MPREPIVRETAQLAAARNSQQETHGPEPPDAPTEERRCVGVAEHATIGIEDVKAAFKIRRLNSEPSGGAGRLEWNPVKTSR